MPARRARSRVDDEIALMIREAMAERGMLQKDLAEASGMTQPQVSVRLSGTASIPIDQVVAMCAAVGLDPVATLRTATDRAREFERTAPSPERPSDAAQSRRSDPPTTGTLPDQERDQVRAVARQLATALWNGADSWDFINIAIEETISRENEKFWDATRRRWVSEIALAELAYSLGRRYPIRDKFPLKPPALDSDQIIR